jgi:hypothetical protein
MELQPGIQFCPPLIEQTFQKSVRQSKCDEVNCFTLLPVGQAIPCKADVSIRIKELHGSGGIMPPFLLI